MKRYSILQITIVPATLSAFLGLYSLGVNLNHVDKTLSLQDISACVSPLYGTEGESRTGYPHEPFRGDVSVCPPSISPVAIDLLAIWGLNMGNLLKWIKGS